MISTDTNGVTMQKFIIALALVVGVLGFCVSSEAASVRGYTKKNGTYVAPHQRTSPNSTKMDNYSTKGNVNPYTGKAGTKSPYKTPKTYTPKSGKRGW